jgi:hypothetical protein
MKVMKGRYFLGVLGFAFVLFNAVGADGVTVYFPEIDISEGIAASPILASAQAEVTSGSGYLDIVLTNTSPLGPILSNPSNRANPFLMEIEIMYEGGFTLNASGSYVSSFSNTWFAQGQSKGSNNPAVQLGAMNLDYNLVAPDSHGMDICFMTGEADNVQNNNTVGSMNVLDGSYIPQEDYADGFLNPSPYEHSGAVFDTILFHFAFNETATPDASLYLTHDTLFVKYIGGGDYSLHQSNVPEPSTVALLGLPALVLLRKLKR